MQSYVRELNRLYNKYDAFYYNDSDTMGFEWMSCDNAEMSTVSFVRRGSAKKDQLLFICNFTPVQRDKFRTGVPCAGTYTEILSSDEKRFGGTGVKNKKNIKADAVECDGKDYSIEMNLPPLSVTIYRFDYKG
jgi:1,4-alpha-glucan branching enzyme